MESPKDLTAILPSSCFIYRGLLSPLHKDPQWLIVFVWLGIRKSNRTHGLGHMLAQTRPLNFLSIILPIYPPLSHIWVQVASEHVVSMLR